MKRLIKYKVTEDLDLGKDPETRKPILYSAGDVVELDKMHLHTKPFKLAIKAGKLVRSDAELVQSESTSEIADEMVDAMTGEGMEKPEGEETTEGEESTEETAEPEAPVEEEKPEEEPPVPDLRNGIN